MSAAGRPERRLGRQAVVVGGSLAGLLAARVLSDYFDQVTLIERDEIHDRPESRKGQPHTRHIHALLASGYAVLNELFPGLNDELQAGGAIEADLGEGVCFYAAGGYSLHQHTGQRGLFASRPFLEWKLARRVFALPNISLLDRRRVTGYRFEDGRVRGVQSVERGGAAAETIHPAELVVDASGRSSSTPRWLAMQGYDAPRPTVVKVNVTYTTRIFRRMPAQGRAPMGIIINPDPPRSRRLGGLFPMEEDRWILTVGGWGGDQCEPDETSHRAFIRSLAAPDIDRLVGGLQPLTDLYRYRFAANLRRHYEKLKRFPAGLLVMGDAVASFNPVYGQGMSSAALQAQHLRRVLSRAGPPDTLWKPYFKSVAATVDRAWELAVGADFNFPDTEGPKPWGTDLINRYVKQVFKATHCDPVVHRAFVDVQNLLAPPASLFRPDIVWRVFRGSRPR